MERALDPPGALPTVSVVVPTGHRPHLLPRLVTAVLADGAVTELIVVVDGDDGSSLPLLTRLATTDRRLRPLLVPHGGQLAALDAGVSRARSEVVLLLDDDVLPTGPLATGHARHHGDRRDLVVVGAMPVELTGRGPVPAGTALYAREYDQWCESMTTGEAQVLDHLWAGNISLRRDECIRVGLHSASFPYSYHADQELGFRLADAGLVGVFDPSLAAVHLHRRPAAAFLRDARRQGAGSEALRRAYPERAELLAGTRFDAGLPAPVRSFVRLAGSTPAAAPIARGVAWGGAAAGSVGWRPAELAGARLARRVMQRRGATSGEGRRRGHRSAAPGRRAASGRTEPGAR